MSDQQRIAELEAERARLITQLAWERCRTESLRQQIKLLKEYRSRRVTAK